MDSVARTRAEDRVREVVDGSVSTNADGKGMREHLKAIRSGAGLTDPSAKGSRDFLKDFGKGI